MRTATTRVSIEIDQGRDEFMWMIGGAPRSIDRTEKKKRSDESVTGGIHPRRILIATMMEMVHRTMKKAIGKGNKR